MANMQGPMTLDRIRSMCRETEDGCWNWERARSSTGYGSLVLDGQKWSVHRLVCELAYGPADGRYALHSCDNPSCCSPVHLRWGTAQENSIEAAVRRPAARRLTAEMVLEARRQHAEGVPAADLAVLMGTPYSTMNQAVTGVTWKHLVA